MSLDPAGQSACATGGSVLLRWGGGPSVNGFEIGFGADHQVAARGVGWARGARGVVDLGGGFLGDARFPGGAVIDALDLIARNGGLLALVDHQEVVVSRSEEHTSELQS